VCVFIVKVVALPGSGDRNDDSQKGGFGACFSLHDI